MCELNEDDELSAEQVRALFQAASSRELYEQTSLTDAALATADEEPPVLALAAAGWDELEQNAEAGSNGLLPHRAAGGSSALVCEAPASERTLALAGGVRVRAPLLQSPYVRSHRGLNRVTSVSRNNSRLLLIEAPRGLWSASNLRLRAQLESTGWLPLVACDARLKDLLDALHARGLRVAAPPEVSALAVGSSLASALPRVLVYGWRRADGGWLEGRLIAFNTNPKATVDGEAINLIATYEQDANAEAYHALSLDTYAMASVNGWLLFEPCADTSDRTLAAEPLEARELLSTPSRKARVVPPTTEATAVSTIEATLEAPLSALRTRRTCVDETARGIARSLGPAASSRPHDLQLSVGPSTSSASGQSLTAPTGSDASIASNSSALVSTEPQSRRPRAIFARSSLHGQQLTPTFLLATSPEAAEAGVKVRLKEQAELTGGDVALATKMRRVQGIDLYLQASSGGHAGLHGAQLLTLQTKVAHIGLLFLDMVREHGTGEHSMLAFPRGGIPRRLFAIVTRKEASDLLHAMQLTNVINVVQTRAEIRSLRDDDDRIRAGQAVLNAIFARLVRSMHAPDGVYALGMSEELLEAGLKKLQVSALLVKQFSELFSCSVFGRKRMKSGGGSMTDIVGWLNEGPHARDKALGKVKPYSEDYVKTTKSILAWWLRLQGWSVTRMPSKGDRPAYFAVVLLETRVVAKAYFTAKNLSTKQKLYRAMAATEEVMQILMQRKNLLVALDLQMGVAEDISYKLGLRLSEAERLNRNSIGFGTSQQRADAEVILDGSKADQAGVGFKRWLQHCHGCEYEWLSEANPDGRAWSMQSAAPHQFTSHTSPGSRCTVCMLLMLLDMQGDAAPDSPLFRKMAPHARWSWKGGTAGKARDFTAERLAYEQYNKYLHDLLKEVNIYLEKNGLTRWKLSEFHWHMFRHGHVIMALIFRTPEAEIIRSLRMEPKTVESYRAHTVGLLGAAFDEAQTQDGVQERAQEVQVDGMVRRVDVSPAAEVGNLRSELSLLCKQLHVTPSSLEKMGVQMQQLVIHGASRARLLSPRFVQPLLQHLHGCATPGDPASALAEHEVPLSTLVQSVDWALTAQRVSDEPAPEPRDGASARGDDAQTPPQNEVVSTSASSSAAAGSSAGASASAAGLSGEVESTIVDDDDGERTVVGNVGALHDSWQMAHAEARAQLGLA